MQPYLKVTEGMHLSEGGWRSWYGHPIVRV
jgi:hypothetical protein